MQQDFNLLEVLKCSSKEIPSAILNELSGEFVIMYYNYNNENNSDKVVYPEDKILKELGYNINDRASSILRDLISSTVDAIDEYGIEEATKLVKNENSFIYVELAHFDYEIGLNKLRSELNRIHENRNIEAIDMEVYEDVYGKENISDVYDSVISIAKYIDNMNKKPTVQTEKFESSNKVLVLA